MERTDKEEELTWAVRPIDRQKGKGFSALLVMMAVMYGAFSMGGAIMGFLSVLILAGGDRTVFCKNTVSSDPDRGRGVFPVSTGKTTLGVVSAGVYRGFRSKS